LSAYPTDAFTSPITPMTRIDGEALMTLATEPGIAAPVAYEAPKSSASVRLASGAGGLIALAFAAVSTLGTVVIVLIAMAVVGGVQRKRGRALTRTGYWVTACSTLAIVLLAISGGLFASIPRGAVESAKHVMDSSNAAAAKQQSPTWVERLYPQYRYAAKSKPSTAMVWVSTAFGVAFVVTSCATLLGTLSWGAGMLLGLAVSGRWPGVQGDALDDLVADMPMLSSSPGASPS